MSHRTVDFLNEIRVVTEACTPPRRSVRAAPRMKCVSMGLEDHSKSVDSAMR